MLLALMLGLYFLLAYVILPLCLVRLLASSSVAGRPSWHHAQAAGVPGDPLNVGLIGTAADVERIMSAAKWVAADAWACAAT